jgi:hypothetical protein
VRVTLFVDNKTLFDHALDVACRYMLPQDEINDDLLRMGMAQMPTQGW